MQRKVIIDTSVYIDLFNKGLIFVIIQNRARA